VRDVDLAPTLYALTGVAPPSDLDGASFAPALEGQPLAPRVAFAETGLWTEAVVPGLPAELRLPYPPLASLTQIDAQHGGDRVLREDLRPLTTLARHRMAREARWKLVYVPTRVAVRWMLFDTETDPAEAHDVASEHPDVVARLQGELRAWVGGDPTLFEQRGYFVPRR